MNTTDSEWRPVPGYEGLYSVSSLGQIRSERVGRVMSPGVKRAGYRSIRLCRDGTIRDFTVALVVAMTFIGPRPTGAWINHIDGNKLNNAASNLEYDTPQENHDHAVGMRLHPWGTAHGSSKLTEQQVREIRGLPHASERVLAARYGVSDSTIHSVRTRKTWRYLP